MSKPYVVDVDLRNFMQEVVQKSDEVPVLVDFWAEWCGPCRALTPILEKLAEAYQGRFILAKCNTDANQQIASQLGIRGIPACKLFRHGDLVDEFQGVQSEADVRRFLDAHCEAPQLSASEMAKQAMSEGNYPAAQEILESALHRDEQNTELRLLLVRALIQAHQFQIAETHLSLLPEHDLEVKSLKQMINYAKTAAGYGSVSDCEKKVKANPQDLEALYQWGVVLSLEDRFEEAMDRFLTVIAKNKNYGEGKVRQAMLAMFEVLGADHPLTHTYRRKFANLIM